MRNSELGFVGVAIVCLIASFIGRNNPIIDGMGKALFGVFIILFFIVRFFGEKDSSPHH